MAAGGAAAREGAPLTLHRVHSAVAAQLRAIQQRHRLPIVATKHLLLPGAHGWRGVHAGPAHACAGHARARAVHGRACGHRCRVGCAADVPPAAAPAGGRDDGGDAWAPRDTMLKPWADLVTHRLVLKAEPAAAAVPAWQARLDDCPPVAFEIGRGGILC